MKIHSKFEKGQAIVLIALAMVGLFGLVALAIDGGNAFADRRQAQNAADAAALAAAMRYGQDQTVTDSYLSNLVLQRTSSNGYNNTAPRSTVTWAKTAAGADCPTGSIGYYFQVNIDSYNPTWFGGVVGVSKVHNAVSAKAIGCAPYNDIAFAGNTIVVTHPTDCTALQISGSFTVIVTSTTNNGIFVNSNGTTNCAGASKASYEFSSGTVTTPSVSVVGSIYKGTSASYTSPAPTIYNPTSPIQQFPNWPNENELCPASMPPVSIVDSDTLGPGRYPGGNPDWRNDDFPPKRAAPNNSLKYSKLNPGIYCLDGKDFTLLGGNLSATGVTFVILNKNVNINGGVVNLISMGSGPTKGLLFYVPKSNPNNFDTIHSVVNITGNGDSYYEGSVVAPWGYVNLNGGGSTQTIFNCQVIAWTLNLGGTGTLNLHYDKDKQYEPLVNSKVGLIR